MRDVRKDALDANTIKDVAIIKIVDFSLDEPKLVPPIKLMMMGLMCKGMRMKSLKLDY